MIYVVLPLAILLATAAVAAFIWATRRGQYDDLDTPALRMLHDDEPVAGNTEDNRDQPRCGPT